MSYYDYDKDNIAKSIRKAVDEYADPTIVEHLLNERRRKTAADDKYAQYKNDLTDKVAQAYIDKYSKASNDEIEAFYDVRRQLEAEKLEEASQKNLANYSAQMAANDKKFSDIRNGVYSAYRRSSLGDEEVLASQGLGRGAGKDASSGFGESARLAQSLAYQNSVYDTYKSQNEAEKDIRDEYILLEDKARESYDEAISRLDEQKIEQINADRKYLSERNNERLEQKQKLLDNEQKAFENTLKEREFINDAERDLFERAYELFKSVGVVANARMAAVLGIDVGTTYWEYVVNKQKANTDYLNYTVKNKTADASLKKATIDEYEAETDRMKLTGNY